MPAFFRPACRACGLREISAAPGQGGGRFFPGSKRRSLGNSEIPTFGGRQKAVQKLARKVHKEGSRLKKAETASRATERANPIDWGSRHIRRVSQTGGNMVKKLCRNAERPAKVRREADGHGSRAGGDKHIHGGMSCTSITIRSQCRGRAALRARGLTRG